MQIEILTPTGSLFSSSAVEMAMLPGEDGSFQILKDHIPLYAVLGKGLVIVKLSEKPTKEQLVLLQKNEDGALVLEIESGLLKYRDNLISIFVQQSN